MTRPLIALAVLAALACAPPPKSYRVTAPYQRVVLVLNTGETIDMCGPNSEIDIHVGMWFTVLKTRTERIETTNEMVVSAREEWLEACPVIANAAQKGPI